MFKHLLSIALLTAFLFSAASCSRFPSLNTAGKENSTVTSNATYTEEQAAQDSRLLAAGKQPKSYQLIESTNDSDIYLIEGTKENLRGGAKAAWFVNVQKTNNYGFEKGDIVHHHFVFNCQGAGSVADIVVYNQNGAVKGTRTLSPYDFLPLPPSSPEKTAVCSSAPSIPHVVHGRSQDLSNFLKPDANKMVYIGIDDTNNRAKIFVEAPKNFQYHGQQARTAWVYEFVQKDTYPFKAGQATAMHIDFSCDGNLQIIGKKAYDDHQLKHLIKQESFRDPVMGINPNSWMSKVAYFVCHYQGH